MLIVSMAVIASRVGNIPAILANLAHQTRVPDKVLLYYSSTPWHHDAGISRLVIPETELNVELIRVPNCGSCRKYLFTIQKYFHTNASILLLDDDLVWNEHLIEILSDYQNKYQRVVGTRGWSEFQIVENAQGEKIFQRSPETTISGKNIICPTEVTVTSSGWATMFYARDVHRSLFDFQLQKSVQLEYSDEIFLAAMLPKSKFIVPMPHIFFERIQTQTSLCRAAETLRAKALQASLL
ncbi:MAG: hypothetical protein WC099_02220 [Candidatus Paceibacterota bacterium]